MVSPHGLPTSAQFRAARAMLGLSQTDLAKLSGTSRRSIVTLEMQVDDVGVETVTAVVDALSTQGIELSTTAEAVELRR